MMKTWICSLNNKQILNTKLKVIVENGTNVKNMEKVFQKMNLTGFLLTLSQKDGTFYEPDTLTSFQRSIDISHMICYNRTAFSETRNSLCHVRH